MRIWTKAEIQKEVIRLTTRYITKDKAADAWIGGSMMNCNNKIEMNPERALYLLDCLKTTHLQKQTEAKDDDEFYREKEYYELVNYLFWLVLSIAPKGVADKYMP